MLIQADTGDTVAGALSIDGAERTVKLDPTADLDAGTAYIAVATTNICDLAGNNLAATSAN